MRTTKVLLAVIGTTLAISTGGPSLAGAADLYTGPRAVSAVLPCAKASPCRLDTALTLAGIGDTIRMLPGEYYADPGNKTPWDTLPNIDGNTTLQGDDPADPPLIHGRVTLQGNPVIGVAAGSTLRDVHVEATSNQSIYYAVLSSGTVDRARIVSQASPGVASVPCAIGSGSIRNSVCLGRGTGRTTALSSSNGAGNNLAQVVNVTAISTSTTGQGITVGASSNITNTINVTNSIARGPDSDLRVATSSVIPVGSAVMNIQYSNWRNVAITGMGTEFFLPESGNQNGATAAEPEFVDAPNGDFRPAAGSPTIDAGLSSANLDQITLGSTVRLFGPAVDIGANEFVPPPTVSTNAAEGISEQGAVLRGSVDPEGSPTSARFEYGTTTSYGGAMDLPRLAFDAAATPVTAPLSGLVPGTVYHYRLVAESNGGGEAASPDRTFTTTSGEGPTPPPPPPPAGLTLSKLKVKKKWRLKRGTLLRFRVSREARVRLTFDRRQQRRLRRRGVRDVEATAGANRVRLRKGLRLRGGKRLAPGRYRLSAVAIAADGTRSARRRASFRVTR